MNEPTQFGRYQMVRVLGRGAMGLVYEGFDPRLERKVAIKVISTAALADSELRASYSSRFVQEAQAVARLNHPHIVGLYDFGEEDGVAYMVMELVRGEELAAYFDMSQDFHLDFTLEDAVRMTCELLEALGYAHLHGVIHRDVKPANVMLSHDLRVKLTDFGVARMAAVSPDQTGAEMVGTPSFMSPEQITGQAVGPQSDLFAAGIILYQFLTNERPFRGSGVFAVQQKILYDQPVPPSVLNPLLSPAFDSVLMRALAKRPEERYPDAAAFREDLRRALNGESIERPAPSPAAPVWRLAAAASIDADPDATRLGAHDLDATVLAPRVPS
ncbi:protein kinase [Massilia sp. G4R7]|uniref:Protein kinase n=1 Tax=Massilia phyllostachyos TaxID=2898585 RepID=A0ABS8Q5Y2_9BURK|nr:serine/threonine-protein kinase [Massilia phyllostachyos]MCD2517146.1 protein kinase [Massilia phyllostachyos]